MRFGIPGLVPEFDDIRIGHLDGFPEVAVHFPVAAVVISVVQLVLEGGSVPNVVIALGNGEGVLRPSPHDPVTLFFVAVPEHEAAGLETRANEDDLLANGTVESDIVGGGPVSAILSVPLAVDNETLGKREDERIGDTLGETGEKVHAGMSFPCEGVVEIGQSVLAPAQAAFAPMVLTVSGTEAVTVGFDGFVAEGTEQMPGEVDLLFAGSPVPVGIEDGFFFVVPVIGIVLSLKILQLPEVAVKQDAWRPELEVLVDVGGVSATTFHLKSDDTVDIDLSVASLRCHPVRRVLTANQSLHDGSFGLESFTDAGNVSRPSSFGAADGVRGPDVSSILASPVPGHMVWVLLARVLLVATLNKTETIMGHAAPDPGAVSQRRTLANGTMNFRDAIHAGSGARRGHEVAVHRAAHVPRVTQRRHDAG